MAEGKKSAYWRGVQTQLLVPAIKLRRQHVTDTTAAGTPVHQSDGLRDIMRSRWGEAFTDPSIVLPELRAAPPLRLMTDDASQWLMRHARVPLDADEWHARLTWSNLAERYIGDLIAYRNACRKRNSSEAEALAVGIAAIFDEESLKPLRRLRDSDEKFVFCGSHLGTKFALDQMAFRAGLGKDPIGLVARETKATHLISTSEPVGALYALVKKLREPQARAAVAPDGGYGTSGFPVMIFDKPVLINTGAPHAIFHARCRNVFYVGKWRGDRIAFEWTFDTQLQPGEKLEAWTERWMTAYRDYLVDVLSGEPENLVRRRGALWEAIVGKPEKTA